MPEIEIRPATAEDIKQLVKMDHSYSSNHVWQMDPQFTAEQTGAVFREPLLELGLGCGDIGCERRLQRRAELEAREHQRSLEHLFLRLADPLPE